MSISDPIADMLTRIRNANTAFHEQVDVPTSKLKEEMVRVLKEEGFIQDFQVIQTGSQGVLRVNLKFSDRRERIITGLKRISKPGLRVTIKKHDIPKVMGGLGLVIMSTPQGVMTGKHAKRKGLGGEVLCYVW